jgi:molecular chaperone GrpE
LGDQKVGDVKEKKKMSSAASARAGADEVGEKDKPVKKKGRGPKARVEELLEELEEAKAEASANYDNWLRARADFDNLKKRTARDVEMAHRRAGEDMVRGLLPVVDDLEKAIDAASASSDMAAMKEGLGLIHKGLLDALRDAGVAALDPAGEGFDPNVHEAVMQRPGGDAGPGTVLEVLQKGYTMNGIVLRAAKVVVASEEKE